MSRSGWKVTTNTLIVGDSVMQNQRKRLIIVADIGKVVQVSNGIKLQEVRIQTNMVGMHLGDLVFTKRYGKSIHIKNTKLNKKKK
jgi:ribosomal protein S19